MLSARDLACSLVDIVGGVEIKNISNWSDGGGQRCLFLLFKLSLVSLKQESFPGDITMRASIGWLREHELKFDFPLLCVNKLNHGAAFYREKSLVIKFSS